MFDILALIGGIPGLQYDPDVDHPTRTYWRVGALDEVAHASLTGRLVEHPLVESAWGCPKEGPFSYWVIRLRKSPSLTLSEVAATFPCLREAPSVLGEDGYPGAFNRSAFWAWADKRIDAGTMSEETRHAVLFILHLQAPQVAFSGIGSFNLPAALASWDRKHLHAFREWAGGFRTPTVPGKVDLEAIAHLAKYPKGDKRFIEALQQANAARWQRAEGKGDWQWLHVICGIAEEMTKERGMTDEEADRFRCTNGRSTS